MEIIFGTKNEKLYVYEEESETIYVSSDNQNFSAILENISMSQDFDIDSSGKFYYSTKPENSLISNLNGTIQTYALPNGYENIYSIYITENDEIYLICQNTKNNLSALLGFDSGSFSVIANKISRASDIVVDEQFIYVTNYSSSCVYKIWYE